MRWEEFEDLASLISRVTARAADGEKDGEAVTADEERRFVALRHRFEADEDLRRFGTLEHSLDAYVSEVRERPSIASFLAPLFDWITAASMHLHARQMNQAQGAETDAPLKADARTWTGLKTSSENIQLLRTLLPEAQMCIGALIASLAGSGHNNGPPLHDDDEVIQQLRELHGLLGEVIRAVDRQELGEGLIVEVVGLTKRLVKNVQDDPLTYAIAALVLAIFSAFGSSDVGALAAGTLTSLGGKK